MPGKVLRVLARGDAMVPVHSAHARGMSRFVGRVWDATAGDGVFTSGGHRRVREIVEIQQFEGIGRSNMDFNEHLKAVRDGDLWAADEATARLCGVKFDSKFGGEYDAVSEPAKAPAAPAPTAAATSTAPEGK